MTTLPGTGRRSNGPPPATFASDPRASSSPPEAPATAPPAHRDLLEPEWDWMAAWGRYLAQRAHDARS